MTPLQARKHQSHISGAEIQSKPLASECTNTGSHARAQGTRVLRGSREACKGPDEIRTGKHLLDLAIRKSWRTLNRKPEIR